MSEEYHTISKNTATPAYSLNTDAVIAGASGAIVLLLLLVFVTAFVLIVYGVQKRKKCGAQDDPAGIRYIQVITVYNYDEHPQILYYVFYHFF